MKTKVREIIKKGWKLNASVSEVIRSIEKETGVANKVAQQEFVNNVFVCMP